MTTEYVVFQLLSQYGSNAAIKALVDKYDFYVLPVVNVGNLFYVFAIFMPITQMGSRVHVPVSQLCSSRSRLLTGL